MASTAASRPAASTAPRSPSKSQLRREEIMPRRSSPPKREVVPDVKYHNTRVTMFINRMMHGGKKSTALRALYGAFDLIEERSKRDPLEVFEQALRNATPILEVKPRRVGGSTYQGPGRSQPGSRALAGDALAAGLGARARWPQHVREAGCRVHGRRDRAGIGHQEERRYARMAERTAPSPTIAGSPACHGTHGDNRSSWLRKPRTKSFRT